MTGTGRLAPSLPPLLVEEAVPTIPPEATATAVLASREDGVLCGMPLALAAFKAIDPELRFEMLASDADQVAAGQTVGRIEGNARAILAAERVALNFLMRMSGLASYTARFQQLISHTPARVTCTRKTVPGMRAFDKYAVKCGGGSNHRYGLDDAILIKDNHIAVCGGVAIAIGRARAFAGHLVKIEVEVDNLAQFQEALAAAPDAVLLDNMGPELLKEAVAMNRADNGGKVKLEASGNVRFETIKAIAETGVDYISTSKITMAAPTLDLGLDIVIG
ncbi:MAG: carboxylating nicotinate-nucleotide diphosphorylase [Nitratireductor sp.]|nr:carboxylating nicotinate-nucleotide diphosphorylase [Nitratireductor sp.]